MNDVAARPDLSDPPAAPPRRGRRAKPVVMLLYARALLREFRITLLALAAAVLLGTALYAATPQAQLGGRRPDPLTAAWAGWSALLGQPVFPAPQPWYLTLLCMAYPVFGFVLVGEGVVRLALLLASRREGEEEWMKVMASTYRDHVILCGLGRLGVRVLEQLVEAGTPVVVLEKSKANPFLADARGMDVPVLVRNMTEDQSLIDAGVEHATAVIICTNDDSANLEVALDARRMNPRIRVVMRLFEQQLARKLSEVLHVDAAFSSSSLAAPLVAALAGEGRAPASSTLVAGVRLVSAEVTVAEGGALNGRTVGEVESQYRAKVLARTQRGAAEARALPPAGEVLAAGDVLVVQTLDGQLPLLTAAAGRA